MYFMFISTFGNDNKNLTIVYEFVRNALINGVCMSNKLI